MSSSRARLTVFLIGLGAAWNAGNVGPVVVPLADEFSVSLSEVGLLSGSVFCAGLAAAGFSGSVLSERVSVLAGLRLCCALCLVGNVLFAISPGFGALLVARVLVGLGLGLAFLYGGVFARESGGPRLVGLFGVGITLGIAFALGIGGALQDLGVDWRFAFGLSAVLGGLPLLLIPRHSEAQAPPHEPLRELLGEAARSGPFWRLELLAISAFSVPIVIGAWLVHYLITVGGLSASVAGLLAFAMFGFAAIFRDLSGQLLVRDAGPLVLSLGALAVAAGGFVILALEPSLGGAAAAVALLGIGLSLPYAVVYDQGTRVLPESPVGGLGLVQAGGNSFPILVVPLLGSALAAGNGDLGWLALAAFVLIAGIANARPAVPARG